MNFETEIYINSNERVRLTANFNKETQRALGLRNVIQDIVLLEPRSPVHQPRKTLVIAVDEIGKEVCLLLEGISQKSQFIKSSRRENRSLYDEQLYFDRYNSTRFIFVGDFDSLLKLQNNEKLVEWAEDQVRIWYFSSFNLKTNLIHKAHEKLPSIFVHCSHNGVEELLMSPEVLATNIFTLSNMLYPSSVYTNDIDIDEVFQRQCRPGFLIHQRIETGKTADDLISMVKAHMRLFMEAGVITEAPLEGVLMSLGIPDSTLKRWVGFEQKLYEEFAPKDGVFHCSMPAQLIQERPYINLWLYAH